MFFLVAFENFSVIHYVGFTIFENNNKYIKNIYTFWGNLAKNFMLMPTT